MYGMAAFGTQMLFPIYNPMAEKNGGHLRDRVGARLRTPVTATVLLDTVSARSIRRNPSIS